MQPMSPNLFAAVAVALTVGACAGGGGSGGDGGGGVVTPPVPYASDCGAKPSALSCGTGSISFKAPGSGLEADGAFVNMNYESFEMDRRGTIATSDDVYVWGSSAGASVVRKTYTNLKSSNDGLGPVRSGANVVRDISGAFIPGDASTLTLFDITNVLKGGLDYVQLGRLSPGPAGGTSGFFAVGRTVPLASMPTTGSARYDGGTRGAYTSGGGTTYATASDVTFTADFATGGIKGSTSNFRMIDSSGTAVAPPHSLDFSFTASIAASSFAGTATSPTMTGSVHGAFHGDPGPPVEASLGFTLRETTGNGTLVGVGGLRNR